MLIKDSILKNIFALYFDDFKRSKDYKRLIKRFPTREQFESEKAKINPVGSSYFKKIKKPAFFIFEPEIDLKKKFDPSSGKRIINRPMPFVASASYSKEIHEPALNRFDFFVDAIYGSFASWWEKFSPSKEPDRVIRILRTAFSTLSKKRKKVIIPEMKDDIRLAQLESDRIFQGIRKVGFSAWLPEAEVKWKEAAWKHFDHNKKDFILIKKEYLEDPKLYQFRAGHEKYDFTFGLIQKILKKKYGKFFGKETLKNVSN